MRLTILPAMVLLMLVGFIGGCGDNESTKKAAPSGETSGGAAPAANPATPVVGTGGGRPQIGMIPRGDGAAYWKTVHAGALKALQEGKKAPDGKPVIEVVWRAPAGPGAQVDIAKELVGKGVAAIVVAPEDEAALVGIVAAAGRVPVVAMDTDLAVSGVKSVIGTPKTVPTPSGESNVLGFTVSKDDVAKLKAGQVQSLIVADAMAMGTAAVKTASDCMREKKVEKRIDLPWHVATKDNMDSPEISPLLTPPVGTYLKE